mmetsp:Transcript_49736/g.137854  ORF Transcript_49736/g.137854 Transcript_49736/m.137854 type:complete len:182 (+) Transcript_49736:1-546(+)
MKCRRFMTFVHAELHRGPLQILVWRCGVLVAAFINCIIFPFQLAFEDRISFDSAPTWTAVYLGLDILLWLDLLLPKAKPPRREWEMSLMAGSDKPWWNSSWRKEKRMRLLLALVVFPWDILLTKSLVGMCSSYCISYAHVPRLLLIVPAQAIIYSGGADGTQHFVSTGYRVAQLVCHTRFC